MADHDPRPRARGDEAELFEAYNHELISAVGDAVRRTTPQVIEDACAFAWAQFMERQPDRDRNWKGWLFRTAQREAWRLTREIGLPIPMRDVEYEPGAWVPIDPRDQSTAHGVNATPGLRRPRSSPRRRSRRRRGTAFHSASGSRTQLCGVLADDASVR